MRGDVQVRFGGRTRETHQLKGWQGALARPYERLEMDFGVWRFFVALASQIKFLHNFYLAL